MKKALVAKILGIVAVCSTYGQVYTPTARVAFDTYNPWPNPAAFAWTTVESLAPSGLAGRQLDAESASFTANLLFGLGSNPSTWYDTGQAVTLGVLGGSNPPFRGGWVFGVLVDVSGGTFPAYSTGPYSFQIRVTGHGTYEGASGMVQFTEPSINPPGSDPTWFSQLPNNYLGDFGGGDHFGLMQVIAFVPEPTVTALAGLGVATLLIFRRRSTAGV